MRIRSFHSLALVAALIALMPLHQSFGQLTVVETFNYPNGLLAKSAVAGIGQTGTWQQNYNDTTQALISVYDTTWSVPSTYDFSLNGKGVGRRTDVAGTTNQAGSFTLANGIDFDADGTVYFSFLYHAVGGTTAMSILSFATATDELTRFQTTGTGVVRAVVGTSTVNGGTLTAGDYLVVGRIDTASSGNDSLGLWVYTSGATVPGSAPAGNTAFASTNDAVGGIATQVTIRQIGDDATRFGEFLLGTTWASVTVAAVPEPASMATFFGIAALALVTFRKRLKRTSAA